VTAAAPVPTDSTVTHAFAESREAHYFLFLTSYLPEVAAHDGRNSQYKGWETEGRLQTTPGDVLDFALVEQDILDDRDAFDVREVGYDPWQATQLAQNLTARGFAGHEEFGSGPAMIAVRATTQNFSAPMKDMDALTRSGLLHHDGDPVFRWMVSNVVCHTDAKDNIYPRKERHENKIDGVVAAIIALGRALLANGDAGPYNATRGIRTL
jgi:phage terminase large subunit-like protein